MQKLLFLIPLALVLCTGCSPQSKYGGPVTTPAEIFATPQNFAGYYYSLKLWQDFVPLDTAGHPISKAVFLQQVATGRYLPIQLATKDTVCYQLFTCTSHTEDMASIRALAKEQYHFYQMEGKPLPGFNYASLNGAIYNPKTTKGKLVVWKCWFIHCATCVAEMPALNQLVDSYKNRNDIIFISVANDSVPQLKQFLAKKPFNYAVAPVHHEYIENDLGISAYPTHIIINKQGLVVKVLDNYQDMEEVLKKEAGK